MANPYPANFEDADGTVRFSGQVDFTDAGNQPGGGGSQPGAVLTKAFLFTERATAGVYSASFPVLAGTQILEVLAIASVGPWAADAAQLTVSDTLSGAGAYYDDLPIGGLTTYDPTNSQAGSYDTLNSSGHLYSPGGFYTNSDTAAPGVPYAADDTITLSLVTTIAVPPVVPSGVLLVKFIYAAPLTPTAASFA